MYYARYKMLLSVIQLPGLVDFLFFIYFILFFIEKIKT